MSDGRIPALARSAVEDLPNGSLDRRAIVWCCDEFYAATEALTRLLAGPEDAGCAHHSGETDEVDLFEATAMPDELRRVAFWFDERYRAHAPRIAWLHFDRFLEIWRFLGAHDERLRREGLVARGERGTVVDGDLLTALVGVDYCPAFLSRSTEPCIGRYRDLLALARAVASGRVRVVEFARRPSEGLGRGEGKGRPHDPAEQPEAFELDDFEEAMEVWYRLKEVPRPELDAGAASFRAAFRDSEIADHLEGSPVATLLLRWFAERFGDPRVVSRLFLRFLIMAGFIEEHFDRLVELGLLRPNGERYPVSMSLFSALNILPLTPSPKGGAEPFEFDTVVAMAVAHRELLGDDVILKRRARPQRQSPRAPVGRHDPCPCGSGWKFKRCCGSMISA